MEPTTSAPQAWEEIAQDRGRRRKEKNDEDVAQNTSNITCGVCDRPFPETRSQEKIDRHQNGHHGLLDPHSVVSCPTCYRYFSRGEIENHITKEHPDSNSSVYEDKSIEILDFTNKINWIKGDEEGKTDGRDDFIHRRSHFKPCLESKTIEELRERSKAQYAGGDLSSLFLFRTKQSKQWPFNWMCSLCPADKTHVGKYRNDISLRVFALRHLKEHSEGVEGLEGMIAKEWKLLKRELHEEIEVHFESDRDLTKTHRSVDYYVTRYSVPLKQLAYEMVRRGKQKMLPQALSLCLVCCNPVFGQLAQHFKAEHPQLHTHGEISEFRKVDEIPTSHKKEEFVFDLLSYSQIYKMKEGRSSTSASFFKWRCIVPCGDEGHSDNFVEFPSINLLRLYVLRHFATFHHRFFRQKFMNREWKLVENDIRLPVDFVSYNPEEQNGFNLNDPNSFCVPFVNKMMPKAVILNEYKICGFCFWCGFKRQFLSHIRQHNYANTGEHLLPNAALESLTEGVMKNRYVTQDAGEPVMKIVGVSGRQLIKNLFPVEPEEGEIKQLEFVDEDIKPLAKKKKRKERDVEEMVKVVENQRIPEEAHNGVLVAPEVDLLTETAEEIEEKVEDSPVAAVGRQKPNCPLIPVLSLDESEREATRGSALEDSDLISEPDNIEDLNVLHEDNLSRDTETSGSVFESQEPDVNGTDESGDSRAIAEFSSSSQDIFSSNSQRERTPVVDIAFGSPKTPIEETPKKMTAMETINNFIDASLDATVEVPVKTKCAENLVNNNSYSPLSRTSGSSKRMSTMTSVAKTEEQEQLQLAFENCLDSGENEDCDEYGGRLQIAEEENEEKFFVNYDMVVPKHDRSFTETPCSTRSAATPIQVTPNLAEIPFDWTSRVIDNFKYDGEEPELTPKMIDVVESLLKLCCPFCKSGLKRPTFVPGPSRDEETVLAHLMMCHSDEQIARDILTIKRCKLRDRKDDTSVLPHIFLLDPDIKSLVCSSCCKYTSKRVYNLRIHFVKCVMRREAITPTLTLKTPRNVETYGCPLNCGIRWKKDRRFSLAVSEIVHLISLHYGQKRAFEAGQKLNEEHDFARSFPFLDFPASWGNSVEEMKFICSKCKVQMNAITELVKHADEKHKEVREPESTKRRCRKSIECPVCMKKCRPSDKYPSQASLFFHVLSQHLRNDAGEQLLRSMNSEDLRQMHFDILPTVEASKELGGDIFSLVCAFCENRSTSVQTHMKHLEYHEHLLKYSTLDEACNLCGQLIPRYGSGSAQFFRFAHLLEHHLAEKENQGIFDDCAEAINSPSLSVEKSLERSIEALSPVFCCSQCPFSTKTSLIFLHHFDEHHCQDKLVPAPSYFCPQCKKSVASSAQYGVRVSLLSHFIRCHKASKEMFENTWGFEWSDKEFPFLNAAKCFEEGKFVCNTCDCKYSKIFNAITHAEMHHSTTNTPTHTPNRKRQARKSLFQDVFKKSRLELEDSVMNASHFDSEFEMGVDENFDATQCDEEVLERLETIEEEGMKSLHSADDEDFDGGGDCDLFGSPRPKTVLGQEIFTPMSTPSIGSPSTESYKTAKWLAALKGEDSATTNPEAKSQDLPSTSRGTKANKRLQPRSEKTIRSKPEGVDSSCCVCEAVFPSRKDLFNHIKEIHSEEESSYPCGTCEKRFGSRKKLRQHEYRIHVKPTMATSSRDSTDENIEEVVNNDGLEKEHESEKEDI